MINELKQARRSAGWLQRTLAARIGIEVQKVKRLESRVRAVSTLLLIMSALDFDLTGIGHGKTLSEQLRNRRLKLKLSLDEPAMRAAMSRTTIASLERGGGSVRSLVQLLAIIAPNARRRAPERSYWGQGDKDDRDSRFTPPDLMEKVYATFGKIDIDPCAHLLSPVVARRRIIHSESGAGLTEDWSGKLAFVNPPFSKLLVLLRRAYAQWEVGNVQTVVCLVPVRTDSAWFHDTLSDAADIYLLQGHVRFVDRQGKGQHAIFSDDPDFGCKRRTTSSLCRTGGWVLVGAERRRISSNQRPIPLGKMPRSFGAVCGPSQLKPATSTGHRSLGRARGDFY